MSSNTNNPKKDEDGLQDIFKPGTVDQAGVRVDNPDEEGMGHGKMGWTGDVFWSSAAERNRDCIASALKRHLNSAPGSNNLVLEIGSGSGQHVVHFAESLPHLRFQPTEYPGHPNPRAKPQELEKILASIDSMAEKADNINKARFLDASELKAADWIGDRSLRAVIAINVVHISPAEVLGGILAGAAAKLSARGHLFFYGPFAKGGVIPQESNRKFDAILKEKNPSFGLRDIDAVAADASKSGLELIEEVFVKESSNYVLCFRKQTSPSKTQSI